MNLKPRPNPHWKGCTSISTFNAMRWVNKAPYEKAYEMQIDLRTLDEQVYPLTTCRGDKKKEVNELRRTCDVTKTSTESWVAVLGICRVHNYVVSKQLSYPLLTFENRSNFRFPGASYLRVIYRNLKVKLSVSSCYSSWNNSVHTYRIILMLTK